MNARVLSLTDHQPALTVSTSGAVHVIPLSLMRGIVNAHFPLDAVPPEVLRALLSCYLKVLEDSL